MFILQTQPPVNLDQILRDANTVYTDRATPREGRRTGSGAGSGLGLGSGSESGNINLPPPLNSIPSGIVDSVVVGNATRRFFKVTPTPAVPPSTPTPIHPMCQAMSGGPYTPPPLPSTPTPIHPMCQAMSPPPVATLAPPLPLGTPPLPAGIPITPAPPAPAAATGWRTAARETGGRWATTARETGGRWGTSASTKLAAIRGAGAGSAALGFGKFLLRWCPVIGVLLALSDVGNSNDHAADLDDKIVHNRFFRGLSTTRGPGGELSERENAIKIFKDHGSNALANHLSETYGESRGMSADKISEITETLNVLPQRQAEARTNASQNRWLTFGGAALFAIGFLAITIATGGIGAVALMPLLSATATGLCLGNLTNTACNFVPSLNLNLGSILRGRPSYRPS